MLFRWLFGKWLRRVSDAQPASGGVAAGARPLEPDAPAPAFVPKRWEMPSELVGFHRLEGFDLPVASLRALSTRLARIPRPPEDAAHLLSEDFLQRASAAELAEAILAHPHIAARMLAVVNAPFYGLAKPVTDLQQAITYLGLDTVRAVAVQCLLGDALAPADPRLKPLFDRWWRASALASQLCLRLGRRVGVSDPGAMVTLAVLSFVGHMAALSLRDPQHTLRDASLDFLDRTRAEQDELGLCAGELGCLMMAEWNMPPAIVENVRAIDRILVMAPRQMDPEQGLRTALTYYCARVAERYASGTWTRPEQATPGELDGAEFYQLQTHFMIQPRMARLAADFQNEAFRAEFDGWVRAALS